MVPAFDWHHATDDGMFKDEGVVAPRTEDDGRWLVGVFRDLRLGTPHAASVLLMTSRQTTASLTRTTEFPLCLEPSSTSCPGWHPRWPYNSQARTGDASVRYVPRGT